MKKPVLFILLLFIINSSHSYAQCLPAFQSYTDPNPPHRVYFSDQSLGSTTFSYNWDFGDGSPIDTSQNPIHTYTTIGTWLVCLAIDDAIFSGCIDTVCDSVSNNVTPFIDATVRLDSSYYFSCTAPFSVFYTFWLTIGDYNSSDSFLVDFNFGDGLDSVWYIPNDQGYFHGGFYHEYLNPGNYTTSITVTGPDSITSTDIASTVQIGATCGNVTGTVYNDNNNNCIYDTGEELSGIGLSIYNGNQSAGWTSSDSLGNYSFNVPVGFTYDIHLNSISGSSGYYNPSCPPSGIIAVNTIPSSGNNFGVVCPAGFDLKGTLTYWSFRQGMTTSICVYAQNLTCISTNAQIDITLSPNLTPLQDTSSVGYTIAGNTVTLLIDSTHNEWSFCFPVIVDVNSQIGDTACLDLNITPTAGDFNPINNSTTYCSLVRNSYDPNDKYADPTGEGVEGFIRSNTDLTYTIRFQNTGNAEAINIYILDTISSNLDAASFEVIGFSHPMTYSLLLGNILRFNFANIMLPDSNANEPASHGYVTYRIKQSPTIAQMAQITNTAYIYFDFNQPVVTNTTLNTMDQFLSAPVINKNSSLVNLFPNPANQKCMIYFGDKQPKTISVSDILGKEVFRVTTSTESYLLNTEKFVNGIYTVQISNSNNQLQKSKLIIAH